MELEGKYKKSVDEFYNCSICVENGIIHKVIVDNAKPIEYFKINPKDNAEFEYYKLFSKNGLEPIECNYKLQYKNQSEETNTVYLYLGKRELHKLKRQQKKYWIQKTDNWTRIVIPIITGVIVYLITRGIYGC